METYLFIAIVVAKVFFLWLVADLITGIIHWWEDAYGNPNWPIIGKYIIEPNLDHHKNPRLLVQGSYWNRVDTSVYAAIIVGTIFWLAGFHSWEMIMCILFSSQGNQIHALAHRTDKENGKIIIFLQKIGLMQRRKTHGWHHQAPYDTNFCVMTEFVNPILNRIHFWKKLEWILLKLFHVHALRGSAIRRGI